MKWGYCAQAKLNELYRQDYMKWWNMKQKNMSFLEYFQTVWNLQLSARHNATFLIILFSLGFFCPFLLIFQINCKNAKLFLRKYFCMNLIYFSRLVWIVHERLNCFLSYLVFCQDFLISWNDKSVEFNNIFEIENTLWIFTNLYCKFFNLIYYQIFHVIIICFNMRLWNGP